MTEPIRSIALITSNAASLVNFRLPLVQAMVASGLSVHALAPDFTDGERAALRAAGAQPVDISMERTGMRPLRDLADLRRLAWVLRDLRPDATLSYFIKPIIYGSLAARRARVPRRFALMAGLGYVFTPSGRESVKRRILRQIVTRLYKAGFGACERVLFHNRDDLDYVVRARMIAPAKALVISGTGVDLSRFATAPVPSGPPRFLLIARMLTEKGVREFAEAAAMVRTRYPKAEFHLVGGLDSNPGALTGEEIGQWVSSGTVVWHGHVADVRPHIRTASVYVLPSYREGKPRSTQEAMAIGRAVVTTDAPGCRDTVEEGVNGFKVPVRDAAALATAIERFIVQPELAVTMGAQSRRLAEAIFDVNVINATVLAALGINRWCQSGSH